jgi:hypothetical protein
MTAAYDTAGFKRMLHTQSDADIQRMYDDMLAAVRAGSGSATQLYLIRTENDRRTGVSRRVT